MAKYKLYRLNGERRIAAPPQFIEATSDEEALGIAASLADGGFGELWEGARLIARLPLV